MMEETAAVVAVDLRYRIAWAGLDGKPRCTPSAWDYTQAEAVLAGAREIAAMCGSHLTFWLEAVTGGKSAYAGWE